MDFSCDEDSAGGKDDNPHLCRPLRLLSRPGRLVGRLLQALPSRNRGFLCIRALHQLCSLSREIQVQHGPQVGEASLHVTT